MGARGSPWGTEQGLQGLLSGAHKDGHSRSKKTRPRGASRDGDGGTSCQDLPNGYLSEEVGYLCQLLKGDRDQLMG